MDVGIIGLAQAGKTTVFNAVTRGRADRGSSGRDAIARYGNTRAPGGGDPRPTVHTTTTTNLFRTDRERERAADREQYLDLPHGFSIAQCQRD